MKRLSLNVEERKVLGKKIKQLRREGWLPTNLYGKNVPSTALQVKLSEFTEVYKEAGETNLVNLKISSRSVPVLIKNLQMDYQAHLPLHADFHQVNLKEKVKAMVPVVLTGEPKAVADKVGMLLQTLNEVEIEAFPNNLVENVEGKVEGLASLGEAIMVGDLIVPEEVIILTDANQQVARIAELIIEEEPKKEEEKAEGEETAGEAKVDERPSETSEKTENK